MRRPRNAALLYAITSESICDNPSHFETAVHQALLGGVQWLQLRAKHLDAAQRLELGLIASRLCQDHQAKLIVNDDCALATRIGADGVHLGRADSSIRAARSQLGSDAIIGASCYADLTLALQALHDGASYVAFGRFFPSKTKPDAPPADIEWFKQIRHQIPAPVCAIGGIGPETIDSITRAGADLIAVVDAVFGASDIRQASRVLRHRLDSIATDPNHETLASPF